VAQGPGKYDDLATIIQARTGAQGIMLAVVGGDKGDGFSVIATLDTAQAIPHALRKVADEIERDLAEDSCDASS